MLFLAIKFFLLVSTNCGDNQRHFYHQPVSILHIIAVMLVDGTMSVFSIVVTSYLDVQLNMATFGRTILILSILVVSFLTTPLTISLAND